ncbi:alpha-galactosidase [Sphingobacterium sp. HJSM2_6]|uniref:alpha-galactosidase n=1 Tax=Sphingobacterium sp. HJSM2_6 TaxID=3366264 RepID=UPI003BD5C3AE
MIRLQHYWRVSLLLYGLFCLPILMKGQSNMMFQKSAIEINKWVDQQFNAKTIPPFSFQYNGQASQAFIKKWKFEKKELQSSNPDSKAYEFSWTDPKTKLKVRCAVDAYPKYQAVEWVLHFDNLTNTNSGQIKTVETIDAAFQFKNSNTIDLHYADGTHVSKADFNPRVKTFKIGESLQIIPESGRSSDNAFPFFNIASSSHEGVIAAVGWTGTWQANFSHAQQEELQFKSGLKYLDAYLKPQESIRTASICLLFWQGEDRMVGHNNFRRFMLEHQTHQINGKPAEYPMSNSFNYGDPFPCNEYTCLTGDYAIALINRYKQFNLLPEVFWLDAGWYTGSADVANNKNWANTVGNWEIDSVRFPGGLKPISEAAHRVGSKFMVWFEPERVIKGTKWSVEHPEFMLDAKGADAHLFNLGNPEALKWLCQYIGDFMEENGIDYYRQDFNMSVDNFWEQNDEAGRRGIQEIRHIEGLYAFWDYLLERFPEAIVDNCASGGRRIDFETMKRSAPMWRTDYHYGEPIGYQTHTYGLNFFLNQTGTGVEKSDKFTFRSSLGTSVVFNWKITDKSANIIDMQNCMNEFKEVRPYFYEDYYPLTAHPDMTIDQIWLGYQLNKPSDDSGFIVAFRRDKAADKSIQVKLSGIKPNKQYKIKNYDTQEEQVKSGQELIDGYTLTLEQPRSSILLKYAAVQ